MFVHKKNWIGIFLLFILILGNQVVLLKKRRKTVELKYWEIQKLALDRKMNESIFYFDGDENASN